MSITVTDKAFHGLIKELNRAHFFYNRDMDEASIHLLATVREGIDTLIRHLKNSQPKEKEG